MPCIRDTARRLTALVMMFALPACVSLPARTGWLPTRRTLGQGTRGAWAHVVLKAGEPKGGTEKERRIVAAGELIEVGDTFVRVLTDTGLVRIQEAELARLDIQVFEPRVVGAKITTALGSLSTPSHGYVAVYTLPIWLAVGLGAKEWELQSALLRHPELPLSALRPFARFPQGLPDGLTEADLGTLALNAEERLPRQEAPPRPASPSP